MVTLGLAVFTGIFDRLRGSDSSAPAAIWLMLYAATLGAALGNTDPAFLSVLALGLIVGEGAGWGAPIGQVRGKEDPKRKPEFYQKWFGGFMWRHPWVALWFRGALWGVATLPAAFFDLTALVIPAALTVAMPAAEWINNKIGDLWSRPEEWTGAWNEFYRGALVGLTTAIVGLFT